MNPKLVLVVGIGGSGKTTLAKEIASKLGFKFVDSQAIKARVGDNTLISSQADAARKKAYRAMYEELFEHAKNGRNAVTDAPHAIEIPNPNFLKNLKQRLRRRGIAADVRIVWVKTDDETMKATMEERRSPSDVHKLQNWDAFLRDEHHRFKVPHPHFLAQRPGYDFRKVREFILR